ncbi:prepilin-type N-terminal cleavage/methylation domain-containing protein [Massilia sp. YIM B04103]|uniref:prepilin-type N-terminal cleavage/methylation domain-containing protein n=1 Tax=Massilia sp. YIM B04103 TaxID=2963106 RepID=UPI00210A3DA4|nr:prepilin-type N-terminal cleavage/methylation domain-containing protein [Massilia sp. YIM B04103]
MAKKRQQGITLVELIVAIVVLSVGLAGVLLAFSRLAHSSTDPMVHKQMIAIAEGMMEEIQRMPFTPDNIAAPKGCARAAYTDVLDYNGYINSSCDIAGNTIPALAGYNIVVTVVPLTPGTPLAGLLPGDGYEITVTVNHAIGSFTLQGWRTNYGRLQAQPLVITPPPPP